MTVHSIKRNVLFNVIGGVWTITLNLVAIRFQLHILGSEAYGLLSFGASLQIFFSLFELGLSTLVTREIAKDPSPDLVDSRALIGTISLVFWGVALSLGAILFLAAEWLVTHWITLEHIPSGDATFVVRSWAIALAFNHPMTFYLGLMAGLRRLDIGNLVKAGVTTAYLGGGIILLILTQNLAVYMVWNVATSVGGVVVYVLAARRLINGASLRPKFSRAAVQQVWRPALQLGLIIPLSIVFTQLDRVLISRFLPVKQLGFYATAYAVISGVLVLQGFVTSAFMPALAADYGRHDMATLRTRYYQLTQLLVYLIGLFAFVCIFFGRDLLQLWATPEAAEGAYRALSLLALGSLLNAAMTSGYILCVVTDNLRFVTLVNVVVIGVYVPLLVILIGLFGIEGAALTWVLLNVYYVATFVVLVQRNIVHETLGVWALGTVAPYFMLAIVFAGGYLVAQSGTGRVQHWAVYFGSVLLYIGLGFNLLSSSTKDSIIQSVRRISATLRKSH